MEISALTTLTTPKLKSHRWDFRAKPASKTILRCLCSNDRECGETTKKRWEVGAVVFGAIAATVMAITPMEADATRIEYYATVGEPPCDLTFVRSGLGFCDLRIGTGKEAPYYELIDVSIVFVYIFIFIFLGCVCGYYRGT